MPMVTSWPAVLASLLWCAGCGDNVSVPPDAALARYEPWALGAVWSYKLTDRSTAAVKLDARTEVLEVVDVGGLHAGTSAFRVRVEKVNTYKLVDEALGGDLDVRFASTFYDQQGVLYLTDVWRPYRLKLDESAEHLVDGAQWTETFTEIETRRNLPVVARIKTNQWRVVSTSEQVTVPAGTFTCLHVNRVSNSGNNQDYWYARGIGKIKETGGDQIEELMSFTPGL